MTRTDLLNMLIEVRGYRRYLEIGVFNEAHNFTHILCPEKVGVDPKPITTFHGGSDAFFEQNQQTFDLIFIDGLHTEEQVSRDIQHSLACLAKGGAIVIHDCLPPNEWYQREVEDFTEGEAWTGTVWKAVLRYINQSQYRCYILEDDWGVGIIDTRVHQKPPGQALPPSLAYSTEFQKLTPYTISAQECADTFTPILPNSLSVSLILVPYNEPSRFWDRIEKVVAPTIKAHENWRFEVIIVDNSDEQKLEMGNMKQFLDTENVHIKWLSPGKNLMYGPAINLAVQHASNPYLVYLCANHGKLYQTDWIDDLLFPLYQKDGIGMTGSFYPSSSPEDAGFSETLPQVHIQGGVFAAKTSTLKPHPYPEDEKWKHWGSDIYQSFQLMEGGLALEDIPTIKSVWREIVEAPERWKYIHDHSE